MVSRRQTVAGIALSIAVPASRNAPAQANQ
jgi:hypothetical protein